MSAASHFTSIAVKCLHTTWNELNQIFLYYSFSLIINRLDVISSSMLVFVLMSIYYYSLLLQVQFWKKSGLSLLVHLIILNIALWLIICIKVHVLLEKVAIQKLFSLKYII